MSTLKVNKECAHDQCSEQITLTLSIVGLCKCNKTFCSHHRLPESHQCTYDYKREKGVGPQMSSISDNKGLVDRV